MRRYMVDHRLLHREATGAQYRTNQTIIGTIIERGGAIDDPGGYPGSVDDRARGEETGTRAGTLTVVSPPSWSFACVAWRARGRVTLLPDG